MAIGLVGHGSCRFGGVIQSRVLLGDWSGQRGIGAHGLEAISMRDSGGLETVRARVEWFSNSLASLQTRQSFLLGLDLWEYVFELAVDLAPLRRGDRVALVLTEVMESSVVMAEQSVLDHALGIDEAGNEGIDGLGETGQRASEVLVGDFVTLEQSARRDVAGRGGAGDRPISEDIWTVPFRQLRDRYDAS